MILPSVLEAPAFVAGFNDFAVMGEPVEESGCHLCITEDAWPFTEGEVCGDDDRGAFVELADEVEQQLTAGLSEGQITQLVEDQEVEAGDQIGGPALAFGTGLGIQLVDQVDNIEEPLSALGPNARSGDADGEMGLAGISAADQHEVALMVEEVSAGQVTDQGLVDLGRLEVELFRSPGN